MQLLLERSSELGDTPGLGLIPGQVTLLDTGSPPTRRIPHIGWNDVSLQRPAPLTDQLPAAGAAFYHVHSYAARPTDRSDVVGTTTYGETFASIIARGAVMGTQFHPEKSSVHGLALLRGFAQCCVPAPARA
jgi:glutamine amidotransferase